MLKVSGLHELDPEARKIKAKSQQEYEEVDDVLYHQELLFVLKVIRTELISQHHNEPFAGYFGINKTRELIGRKYYWPSLRKDVEAYIKGCNVCLASKVMRHKP